MPDVTVVEIDEMESFYGGLARRARAALGVTAWGMQVMTLPPHGRDTSTRTTDRVPSRGRKRSTSPLTDRPARHRRGAVRVAARPDGPGRAQRGTEDRLRCRRGPVHRARRCPWQGLQCVALDQARRSRTRVARRRVTKPARPRAASRGDASPLLAAAKRGDDAAFSGLVSPHQRALHLHCYRLLGSLHDADDALQETLVNAWRGLGAYEPHAPLIAWLYRIATNVALRMLERRGYPRTRSASIAAVSRSPARGSLGCRARSRARGDTRRGDRPGGRGGDAAAAAEATCRADPSRCARLALA